MFTWIYCCSVLPPAAPLVLQPFGLHTAFVQKYGGYEQRKKWRISGSLVLIRENERQSYRSCTSPYLLWRYGWDVTASAAHPSASVMLPSTAVRFLVMYGIIHSLPFPGLIQVLNLLVQLCLNSFGVYFNISGLWVKICVTVCLPL